MRYITQLKKFFYLCWCLEALGLKISSRDVVHKMLRGSMVVLKGVRCYNLYYLRGNTVIGQVVTSISTDDDCTLLWHMRLEHIGENPLQALAK